MKDNKKNVVVIDDGRETIEIVNKQGKTIGQFCFRPTDTEIINRYNESIANIEDLTSSIRNVENGDKAFDEINSLKAKLFDIMDYVFDGNVSEAFFGNASPFMIINGNLYFEIVIDAVGNYIAKRFDKEIKRINYRVNNRSKANRPKKNK